MIEMLGEAPGTPVCLAGDAPAADAARRHAPCALPRLERLQPAARSEGEGGFPLPWLHHTLSAEPRTPSDPLPLTPG